MPMAARILLSLLPPAFVLLAAGRTDGNYVSQTGSNSAASEPLEVCEFGLLPCDDEQCVPRKGWCDGSSDCLDGSDERYCRQRNPSDKHVNINSCVKSLHFECDSGECIPKAARCDDMPDCSGGEDEENCDYYFEWTETDSDASVTSTTESTTTSTPEPKTTSSARLPLLSIPSSRDALKKALSYILQRRNEHWGWGKSTAQMTVALYLANKTYFDPNNYEGQLSKKQLEVQLAIDLMKKEEILLRLPELSHYVHALLVTCQNPKDFHGVNLLRMLKKQINRRHAKKQFVTPLAYLALCNAGEFSDGHIRRMKNMAYRRSEEQRWLDIQAYALLAIACYSHNNSSSVQWRLLKEDVAKNITEWQHGDGSFGSIYSTGLALQALIAAEQQGTESAKGRAMTYLKLKQNWEGSFGSEMDNFYVSPALNLNSMAAIAQKQCKYVPASTQNTEASISGKKNKSKKKKMHVHYSLWIGGERSEMHTITLALPPHSSFVDVMETAERANPKYKHEIWMGTRGPVVESIAGRPADVEKSLYWTLYRKVPLPFRPVLQNSTATTARLRLLGATRYIKDLRKLHPKDGEHLAFWLKPYL